VFRCLYDLPVTAVQTHGYFYDAVTVEAYGNAATAAEAADGKHSTCTEWVYPSQEITYEFYKEATDTVKSTVDTTITFSSEGKNAVDYSHVKTGPHYDVQEQSTCEHPGSVEIDCAICGERVVVPMEQYEDTFGA
jgi:hypothetical protein